MCLYLVSLVVLFCSFLDVAVFCFLGLGDLGSRFLKKNLKLDGEEEGENLGEEKNAIKTYLYLKIVFKIIFNS